MGIPVAHVESGLRSFDRTMPEEVNRIVADRFSAHLFLHSDEAVENLRAEGIADERMHLVGNTMIDTLVALEDRFRAAGRGGAPRPRARLLRAGHAAPAGAGRRAAAAARRSLQLAALAREMPVVFPVHPRTRKMMGASTPSTPACS